MTVIDRYNSVQIGEVTTGSASVQLDLGEADLYMSQIQLCRRMYLYSRAVAKSSMFLTS